MAEQLLDAEPTLEALAEKLTVSRDGARTGRPVIIRAANPISERDEMIDADYTTLLSQAHGTADHYLSTQSKTSHCTTLGLGVTVRSDGRSCRSSGECRFTR